MLTGVLLVTFATWATWHGIKAAAWFYIPARLAPFIVMAVAVCWSLPFAYPVLDGAAATGGTALLNVLSGGEGIPPWKLTPAMREMLPFRRKRTKTTTQYIPTL